MDMIKSQPRNSAEILVAQLGNTLDYSRAETSFSPFFSDMGLGMGKDGGIANLFLHYNRKTTIFLTPFLAVPQPLQAQECSAIGVTQRFAGGAARIAFCGHNTWVVDCDGLQKLEFTLAHAPELTELRHRVIGAEMHLFDGYLPNLDPRDPDKTFPIVVGIRIMQGKIIAGDGVTQPLQFAADDGGRLVLAFSVRMLEVSHAMIVERLRAASATAEDATTRTLAWLKNAMGGFRMATRDPREQVVLSRALHTLLSNSTEAPGLLAGRVAAFPNRGTYPTHYLWDSCFQNLATERLHPKLAGDSLLLLVENMRVDGKMPHFTCSTWIRPHESQPPLVGWAGLRLVQERKDKDMAARLLPALRRNTQWWLSQRMTRFGLIAGLHGLETGWDDSPRFDRGALVATDMNTYVLLQMRACAEFARMLGDEKAAQSQADEADQFARRMVEVLFDREAGLFWDLHQESGEPLKLKTPACFLPLLADVPLSQAEVTRMVKNVLLNPAHFFGPVPFPTVAYDEGCYKAGDWWRGPVWLPIAYLMTQVLEKTGFHAEAQASRATLYRMLIQDGNLRELFNSQTGEGMGAYEQGWTAAICLRLHDELSGQTADS